MKKLIFTFLFVWVCSYCGAYQINLNGRGIGEELLPHKNSTVLLTVYYEDGILTVWSPTLLSDVTVIIRDEGGTPLYIYNIYGLVGNHLIYLPSSILIDMYSVELLYGDIHLIGYF